VLAADGITDRSLAAALSAKLARVARRPFARAAAVQRDGDSERVKSPPGTKSIQEKFVETRDDSEPNPGSKREISVDTQSTRIVGSSSRKTKTIKADDTMPRCPDANGVAKGGVKVVVHERFLVSKAGGALGVIDDVDTFEGDVVVQFGDDARIATVIVTGAWSYTTQSSLGGQKGPRHFISGTVTGTKLGPDRGGNGRDVTLTTRTTGASGDKPALHGDFGRAIIAEWLAEYLIEEALSGIQRRAVSGDCVRVEPDPPSVHVSAGGSVEIGGRVIGADGVPFSGPIAARAERGGSVVPEVASGDPRAAYTYRAAAAKPAGGTDTVRLSHTSRRGVARSGSVTVIYDEISHTYRVLAVTLDERITGDRDGGTCPGAHNEQVNTMSLGIQPPPTIRGGSGSLFEGSGGFEGLFYVSGLAQATTTLRGCDVASETEPYPACTNTGSELMDVSVRFAVVVPKTGHARLRWSFNGQPTAGLGHEGDDNTCYTPSMDHLAQDLSIGDRTVPREVFEAATPQTVSVEIELDLTDPDVPEAGRVHAIERYSMTFQRVRDDGSPL
jgi:hypothetical protein